MNLIPANQTLIPAGEPAWPARALPNGAVLRRVIVVQAEYAPGTDVTPLPARESAPNLLPYDAETRSSGGGPSTRAVSRSPVEQYARIQRGDASAAALIDVHA
ncbi:MAG: hypothetical protein ACLPWG_13410 [Steroidobacteraceae bacterium]